MNLELNGEEKKYLQQAISRYLDDLGHEIARTENAEFRHDLLREEEMLKVLRSRLEGEGEDYVVGLA